MKNIIKYFIEFFLHLKYGEIYVTENFSLKFPYYYLELNEKTKQFVFVVNNEIKFMNDSTFYFLKICVLGFGFAFKFIKNK